MRFLLEVASHTALERNPEYGAYFKPCPLARFYRGRHSRSGTHRTPFDTIDRSYALVSRDINDISDMRGAKQYSMMSLDSAMCAIVGRWTDKEAISVVDRHRRNTVRCCRVKVTNSLHQVSRQVINVPLRQVSQRIIR